MKIECPHRQGIATYLFISRNQFFSDGNKRTARLMMNGLLLANGHDLITVPAKKRLEFNSKMLRFYGSGDGGEMFEFLIGCSLDRNLQVRKLGAERTQPAEGTPRGGSRPPQGGGSGENNDQSAERDENATPPPGPAETTGERSSSCKGQGTRR